MSVHNIALRGLRTRELTPPMWESENSGARFSKLLRKILGRLLILGQSLTIRRKPLTRHNFSILLLHDLTTTSRRPNNIQHDAKIYVLNTIYCVIISQFEIALPNKMIFYKIRNLPEIFLRSFENMWPQVFFVPPGSGENGSDVSTNRRIDERWNIGRVLTLPECLN